MGISYRFTDALSASYMHTEKKYSIEYYAHRAPEVGKIQHFDYKDKEDFLNLSYDRNDFPRIYFIRKEVSTILIIMSIIR